jgi:hypothetical protein
MDLFNTIKEWFGISADSIPEAINPEELQSTATDAVQQTVDDTTQQATDAVENVKNTIQ